MGSFIMAKKTKDDADKEDSAKEPFENEPSSLDDLTHTELRLMHEEASAAILFAKNIQWQSVGASLVVFGACIAIAVFTSAGKAFVNLLSGMTILLACGVIFVLIMYQFWQFNEIKRIKMIEKNFSTLYRRIRNIKSRREGNVHRYTLLLFMITVVILGAVVANIGINQSLHFPRP